MACLSFLSKIAFWLRVQRVGPRQFVEIRAAAAEFLAGLRDIVLLVFHLIGRELYLLRLLGMGSLDASSIGVGCFYRVLGRGRDATATLAFPPDRGTRPNAINPPAALIASNVTVPVAGVPSASVTCAVHVTFCPRKEGLGEPGDRTVVEVLLAGAGAGAAPSAGDASFTGAAPAG